MMVQKAERLFVQLHQEALMQRFMHHLAEVLPDNATSNPIQQAMRHSLLGNGKRIRPILMMLFAQDLGYQEPSTALLEAALSIEMVHTASLILDDLPCMDNAELRRGEATLHRQFGEETAILTSVSLLTSAIQRVSHLEGVTAAQSNALVMILSQAVGEQGLCQGQMQDLKPNSQHDLRSQAVSTNQLKTGVLFQAMFQMVLILCGSDQPQRNHANKLAFHLGQLYQLLDDLSDKLTTTGKDCFQDRGKATLGNLLGQESAYSQVIWHHQRTQQCLQLLVPESSVLDDFIQQWLAKAIYHFKPVTQNA